MRAPNEKSHFDLSISFRLITHAKQLLEDNEETLCVRVLQTIKGMMARDIDFGDKVLNNKALMFPVVYVHAYRRKCLPLSTQEQLLIYSLDAHEFKPTSSNSRRISGRGFSPSGNTSAVRRLGDVCT